MRYFALDFGSNEVFVVSEANFGPNGITINPTSTLVTLSAMKAGCDTRWPSVGLVFIVLVVMIALLERSRCFVGAGGNPATQLCASLQSDFELELHLGHIADVQAAAALMRLH